MADTDGMSPNERADSDSVADHDEDIGKGAHSSQVRKAQNRLAQREFRLRKQQYIRDLETKVEVLSGDKNERAELMNLLIRNLLKENKDLRNLVKNLSQFLGEGMGSCLPRLGLTAQQLDTILNRADTETAYEAFANFKASKEMQDKNPGMPLGDVRRKGSTSSKRKRSSLAEGVSVSAEPEGDMQAESSRMASARQSTPSSAIPSEPFNTLDDYAYLFGSFDNANTAQPLANQGTGLTPWLGPQMGANAAPNPGKPGPGPGSAHPDFGNQLMANPYTGDLLTYGQISQMNTNNIVPGFVPQYQPSGVQGLFNNSGFGTTGTVSASAYPFPTMTTILGGDQQPPQSNEQSPSLSPTNTATTVEDKQRRLREAVAKIASGKTQSFGGESMSPEELEQRQRAFDALKASLDEDHDWNERKTEVIQLLVYHLNNFRVNHSYNLPPSLRPTKVQRTLPHEHVIDGVIFPGVRDRMILLRGRYDLVEAFQDMMNMWQIREGSPLDHHAWEIPIEWIRKYEILADDEAYDVSDSWRAKRGEPPLPRPSRSQ